MDLDQWLGVCFIGSVEAFESDLVAHCDFTTRHHSLTDHRVLYSFLPLAAPPLFCCDLSVQESPHLLEAKCFGWGYGVILIAPYNTG